VSAGLPPVAADTGVDVTALRRSMRDLVALSTLPAALVHAEAPGIADSLIEVLVRMLGLELAYLRVPFGGERLEAGRARNRHSPYGSGAALGRWLENHLRLDGSEAPRTIPEPGGEGALTVAVLPIGHDRDCGWLVAACRDASFPVEHDRLLLGVAINQLVLMLQHKAAEATLRETAARLAESDKRKDEFLATLAHELRNPLAAMRTAIRVTQLAPGRADLAGEAQAMLGRQLEQLIRLVDDLLDLSRISVGKIDLRREPVELAAIVGSALETVTPMIERSEQGLEVSLPEEGILLDADPVRVAQVISNLLNNASKYTPRGGRVALTALRNGNEVEISVRDNGIGIPAEMLPCVFEMFTQVDSSLEKAHGGLGIGLTIVKRLTELHGGSVQVRSEGPGRGSEFVVRMPLAEKAMPVAPARGKPSAAATSRRVLVVDDNPDAASSLSMLLQALGHEVSTAPDGLSGLAAAESRMPEVVLLDIGMPGLNGYDACERIRAQPWGRDLTLVALSGWGQDEHKARARAAGFDHHFIKPVDVEALSVLLECLPERESRVL
jgi:signal transduction histidine kinase/ActR/RegA family two-component response regulator